MNSGGINDVRPLPLSLPLPQSLKQKEHAEYYAIYSNDTKNSVQSQSSNPMIELTKSISDMIIGSSMLKN